jgi:ATPase family AAA domain-containing protein 3A/B
LHPPSSPVLPPAPQAELTKDVERAKKLAEAEGRIKENRENEDVNRRAALLK